MAGEVTPYVLAVGGVAGLAAAFGGLVLLYRGVSTFRTQRAFGGLETADVSGIQSGDSVKLVGTAEAVNETITGAFTGREAVAVCHEVSAHPNQRTDRTSDWDTVHTDDQQVVFGLVAEDGSVSVKPHPDCLDYDHDRAETVVVDAEEVPPARIREYADRTDALTEADSDGAGGRWADRRRYRETAIQPGDTVLVYGQAIRDPAGEWGDSLTVVPEAVADGLVTNRSVQSLAREGSGEIAMDVVVGLLLVAIPLLVGVGLLIAMGVL